MIKNIEVIARFDTEGKPTPIRFKLMDDAHETLVVNIDRVARRDITRFASNRMLKFICEVHSAEQMRLIEIRYETDTCKWFLY